MNADRINEHYYGDSADPATERARQRIHWMCGQAVGKDILDIGCSQGILCLILGREGFRCVGIDIEAASLDVARRALVQEDEIVQRRVTFEVADASQLPFEDMSFDSVVLGEVLEHLTHPVKVLSEAKRVLRDEGRLIVTVPYGLNAFHDHKCTYYPIPLLELLQPLFKTAAIDTLGNYITYAGVKDPAYDPAGLCAELLFNDHLRLANAVQARCLEKERALFEMGKSLHAKIKVLTAKSTAHDGQIKELNATITAKDEQLNDLTITSQQERERAATHREAAARKVQDLLETNRRLQELVEGLTAQRTAQEQRLEELEKTLAAKELQVHEMEHSSQSERELAARHRDAAAKKEQELLETNRSLQEQVEGLTAQRATQERRLEELEKTLASKELQVREMELRSQSERELAARHRDAAAKKEQELLETNRSLQEQVEGLTAQRATQERRLEELEKTLAAKEQQVRDLELSSHGERELEAAHRALADLNAERAAEREQLLSLQAENARTRQELAAREVSWQERLEKAEALHADRLRAREKYFQQFLAKREAEWNRKHVNQRIRELARASLPADAHVLVISKGDDDVLRLDGRHGQHFPQAAGGVYAGYHPANAADAISHLETLKARGAQFLLIPATSLWWLEYYAEFRQFLETNCSLLLYEEGTCAIYALRPSAADRSYKVDIVARNGAPLAHPPLTESRFAGIVGGSSSSQSKAAESPNGAVPVTLGVILDEFTTSCLQPECRLVRFRPDNWRKTLEQDLPDALFVESAWRGNDGAWQYRIANYDRNMGNELADLLHWAEQQAIPAIFWNKEDPVHFDRFIARARLFSHVFTTDVNCIPRYRESLGHERVFALPFAAQPAIHNPIQSEPRAGNVCFAGTYYGSRHEARQNDMDFILQPAIPFGLEIYDRQQGVVGTGADTYRFPDIYQACIKGRLEYDEMVKAYKRYRVFLNVNSVKQSPTMFSRRVFELLACGTPVISTYSHGIVELLGEDVVFLTESETDTRRLLERLLGDDEEWVRASARGIRKVMREHTYGHRLRDVFQRIGISFPRPQEPRFTVVVRIGSEAELPGVAPLLSAQNYRRFDVILQSDARISAAAIEPLRNALPGVSITSVVGPPPAVFGQCRELAADYFAFLDPRDSYGPDYLLDHALAVQYSAADLIGKHTFYQKDADDGRRLKQSGYEFRYVTSVQSASLVAKNTALSKDLFAQAVNRRVFHPHDRRILSIDRFNYLQNAFVGRTFDSGHVGAAVRHVEVYA